MRMVSTRRSTFAMKCIECEHDLIAPERSEHQDERYILHFWRCPKCDCCFEVISPADTKSIEKIMRKIDDMLAMRDVFPLPLVAQGSQKRQPQDHSRPMVPFLQRPSRNAAT